MKIKEIIEGKDNKKDEPFDLEKWKKSGKKRVQKHLLINPSKDDKKHKAGVNEGVRWVKRNGHLVKVKVPDSPAEIQAKAMRQAMALPKREPLALKPIPNIDWEDLQRIFNRSGMPLGGEIADIIQRKPMVIRRGGKDVAALKLVLYVEFDLKDMGYTDADIAQYGENGGRGVSDAITVYLYRKPKNPRVIAADYTARDYDADSLMVPISALKSPA